LNVAAHFPHIRALHLKGPFISLHDCPAELLSILSSYDQVTVPFIRLPHLVTDSPMVLDLSRITVTETVLRNASDVIRLNQLQIRVKGITLMSTAAPDPVYRTSWSAKTYPGLIQLFISGSFYPVSDKTMLLDFISRHPTLTILHVLPEGHDQDLNSFYLTEGLSNNHSPTFTLRNATFKRADVSGSTSEASTFECSSLSVYSQCSGLDDFAALIGHFGKLYPTIVFLGIDAAFWNTTFHEIPVVQSHDIMLSTAQILIRPL